MYVPISYVYEFRVPIVLYGEETHIVFAQNEEEAYDLLRSYGNHAAYDRKIHETEYLYTDARLVRADLDSKKDPCDECCHVFETLEKERACGLTLDENGFRMCDNMDVCPLSIE